MNQKIEMLKQFRIHLLGQIRSLTPGQLNTIPAGYSNNIIWNLGHLIAAQEVMCYARSGLPFTVEERFIQPYLTGTRPEASVGEAEIRDICRLAIESLDHLQRDHAEKKFHNYTPSAMIPKVYGFEVTNIDAAIDYLLYHEGFHSGYISCLKRHL